MPWFRRFFHGSIRSKANAAAQVSSSNAPASSSYPPESYSPPADQRQGERIQIRLNELHDLLVEHDTYVRTTVARELTLSQLLDSLASRTHSLPLNRRLIEVREELRDNQKRILGILHADPTRYYSYRELADMTLLTADGVRSLVSEMARMGCRFKKRKEGRKAVIALELSGLDSHMYARAADESNESTLRK